MGRSGYVEDVDGDFNINLYRASVDRAFVGRRGQRLLREMAAALDAMPVKELIAGELMTEEGAVCALGAVAARRQMSVAGLDPEDADAVGKVFDVAPSMAREIVFMNDDDFNDRTTETPAARWTRMRAWVESQIKKEVSNAG